MKQQTVIVGLSGGVDSAVTAVLLQQEGYKVVGAHMKNWSQDIAGFECPWREDYQAAKQVATFLGIEFILFDFRQEYRQKVVDYMLDEFRRGQTPNPDIMCNQEIKFKLFLDRALAEGADLIATGHYARTQNGQLLRARDESKDQTYFLYRVTSEALARTLFPLGAHLKSEVRLLAAEANLPNAARKESMGICFVGKVGIKEFLSQYVDTSPGDIIENGQVIGQHDGAIFYTIGQRHGLGLGGGLPYYVIGKNMDKNEVYVTRDLNDQNLWSDEVALTSLHQIGDSIVDGQTVEVRLRHRAPLISATINLESVDKAHLKLAQPAKAITPGQSAVFYNGEYVMGGGIVY